MECIAINPVLEVISLGERGEGRSTQILRFVQINQYLQWYSKPRKTPRDYYTQNFPPKDFTRKCLGEKN